MCVIIYSLWTTANFSNIQRANYTVLGTSRATNGSHFVNATIILYEVVHVTIGLHPSVNTFYTLYSFFKV